MGRSTVQVSRIRAEDAGLLTELWLQAQTSMGHSRDYAQRSLREGKLTAVLDRPDVRVYLARVEDRAVGLVAVMHGPVSALSPDEAIWIDLLYVAPGHRRRGVAKVMLARVADLAEHLGADEVICHVPVSARDMNRYFARLGFTNATTQRRTSPGNLRRRLEGHCGRDGTVEAVRQRRAMRARSRLGLRA